MKSSYKILSVFDIDIELHLFFLLFILGLFLINFNLGILLTIVFFFVVLHELSHSITALKNGVNVTKIVLLPIGGVSMMNTEDVSPITEVKIAIAGPLLNFILVLLLFLIIILFKIPLIDLVTISKSSLNFDMIINYSLYANLILGLFNLFIPAFPMDGGRLLRGLLALKLDYLRATKIARNISIIISGLLFIFGDLWIKIISIFIAFGALAEYNGLILHRTLKNVKVKDALTNKFLIFNSRHSLAHIITVMSEEKQVIALRKVKDKYEVIDLRLATMKDAKLKDVLIPVKAVFPSLKVEKAIKIMQEKRASLLPVVSKGKLLGIITNGTIENLRQLKKLKK